MKSLFSICAIASLLMFTPWANAADGLPVPPYQARYEVYASGFSIGEAVVTLAAAGSDGYQMRSDVQPNGLAALFASGRIQEQASGHIRNGVIYPDQYQRRLDTGRKSKQMQADFDWPAGQMIARNDGEAATLPLSPGIVDPLSLQLLVMSDLKRGQLPNQYRLVEKIAMKTYQIRNQGEEILETPLGPLRTVRINQSTPGKTRMTTLWIAPELHYLVVRIAQEKSGKEELRMELRSVARQP